MSLKAGMSVPSVRVHVKTEDGIDTIDTKDYFAGRKVVLFSVPGAFTPTCSAKHLPGFVSQREALSKAGIDAVACLSVNDAHVMKAWGDSAGATGKIDMLADSHALFARALGIAADFGEVMGERTQRTAFIIDNGVVEAVFIEDPGVFEVSSAEHILGYLGS